MGFVFVFFLGFAGGSDGKESDCNAGDLGSIPGSGRSPGEGNGNPLQLFLAEEFHRLRSLAGSSSWGHKETDTIEQLTLFLRTKKIKTTVSRPEHAWILFYFNCSQPCMPVTNLAFLPSNSTGATFHSYFQLTLC